MLDRPGILKTNIRYFLKLLKYHNIDYDFVRTHRDSNQVRVQGFTDYNYLVDINHMFSTVSRNDIIDRTQTVETPFKMHVWRPWVVPTGSVLDLESCIRVRVHDLLNTGNKVNLMWSGGIDSTSMIIGFLKHCSDLSRVRVIYSTYCVKENPYFLLLLQDYSNIELVEFGGDVYLDQDLDGIFVTGDGSDDLTASLDQSFIDLVGYDMLFRPWQDLIYQNSKDDKMIEFFDKFLKLSGKQITTVLEAKQWFYTNCKIQAVQMTIADNVKEHQPLPIGFYDNPWFEQFMLSNTEPIMPTMHYSSYKQFLKDYIYEFDKNKWYYKNKTKANSKQIGFYRRKKTALQDTRHIMILGDGTRIRTDNLPLLSEKEYRTQFGDSLEYLFNRK